MKVHPLCDETKPFIRVIFEDSKGKHSFLFCTNEMTGDSLCYFSGESPSLNESLSYVKSIYSKIKEKAKILECTCSKHFNN